MKLGEIYRKAVAQGIKSDPRSRQDIDEFLKKQKKAYDKLSDKEKKDFDTDKLENPYADTRLLYGDPEKSVKKVIVGIDMEVSELLLADRLNQKGAAIDAVIAHHPEGKALLALGEVMHLQEDILFGHGVPINVAEGIMSERIGEVTRGIAPINAERQVDAARLLDIPLMCLHTVADNQVHVWLQKEIDRKAPKTLGDLLDFLKSIPEYAQSISRNAGPSIFSGSPTDRAGKIIVDMTGGTEGSDKAYEKLAAAGVGTVVGMHMTDKLKKEADKNNVHVVIAGHIASDSIGLNLLLDEVLDEGVEVLAGSGFIRHSRKKKTPSKSV